MKPWHDFQPVDLIAMLIIVAGMLNMVLRLGYDLSPGLTLIAGYYFGKKASTLPQDKPLTPTEVIKPIDRTFP